MGCMARRLDTQSGPATIGTTLQALRRRAGMTQEQLAKKAGISRATIIKLESGAEANPKVDTIADLEAALGVAPGSLLSGSAPSPVTVESPMAPDASDGRISLSAFLSVARGVLEPSDVRRLEMLRTRLDPRGLTRRAWLRTVIDLREDDSDGDQGLGG